RLDEKSGREYDGQSACMAASAACLAKANGLSRIDQVLLSEARGEVRQGENMFVLQGEPGDPAQRRATMKTQDAANTPVEQSLAQMQALNETQQRQAPVQAMDEPRRELSPQMRMG
ncbi:MAG: XVIPCD domain-containing protein, partial [Pseudoxanthomonas sp.]